MSDEIQSLDVLTLQGEIPDSMWPMPKDRIAPKTPATLLPQNQIACLVTCSDGLYQIDVIRLKPGEIMLSNIPSRNRRANSEAKLEAAP